MRWRDYLRQTCQSVPYSRCLLRQAISINNHAVGEVEHRALSGGRAAQKADKAGSL
jgi:hypothetical protein